MRTIDTVIGKTCTKGLFEISLEDVYAISEAIARISEVEDKIRRVMLAASMPRPK